MRYSAGALPGQARSGPDDKQTHDPTQTPAPGVSLLRALAAAGTPAIRCRRMPVSPEAAAGSSSCPLAASRCLAADGACSGFKARRGPGRMKHGARAARKPAASEDGGGGFSAVTIRCRLLVRSGQVARVTRSALRIIGDFKLTAIVVFSSRRARIVPTSRPEGHSCLGSCYPR